MATDKTTFWIAERAITFPRRSLIMSIVNINDDSFSADGSTNLSDVIQQAREHVMAGADIIDIGAESARTNRQAISEEEEIARLTMFLECWQELWQDLKPRDEQQIWPPLLSVNTWRTAVISKVLAHTVNIDIINDMSALPNPDNALAVVSSKASLLIMHSVGLPKQAHTQQQWSNVMQAIQAFFAEKIVLAQQAGLSKNRLILDPGIDFAKQQPHNRQIYQELVQLHRHGCLLLLPVSRKDFIGQSLSQPNPKLRDAGTVGCMVSASMQQAHIFRVHNTESAWQTLQVISRLAKSVESL